MHINADAFNEMMTTVAGLWHSESKNLCEIDAVFGDGDHGIAMNKIADLIMNELSLWDHAFMEQFLSVLGSKIMSLPGGSAASLYSCVFSGLAIPAIRNKKEIGSQELKEMLKNIPAELSAITKAGVGDKTMMDSLIPAVSGALSAQDDIEKILWAAKEGAKTGAESTTALPAKYGRAKNHGAKSVGCMDAGAVSMSLFFTGLYKGYIKYSENGGMEI